MPLIALLAFLLLAGVCYLLFVWGQVLFGALRRSLGQGRNAGTTAPARERQPESPGAEEDFIPGFRKIHFSIFEIFVLVYSLLAWVIWGGYYRTFKAILMTICGPFTTAILDPTGEHWKTAWALFPFCAAFLLWGIFCQLVRLPFQRAPRQVALVMWAIGLMIWFDAAILSYLLAV
jgi:hypothetical protein